MSDFVGAKAISLASRGGVKERPHARVFVVEGSGGNEYVVVRHVRPGQHSCTCPAGQAGRTCYHVRAAGLVARR